MPKLISIIIPTYNRGHIISETLESVLNQTYTYWECIIIDDGSTDDTIRIIQEYSYSDERFIFLKRPDNKIKGAATCRNIGLKIAKGSYIQFLDSDDLLDKNKFESQLKVLEHRDKFTLSTCKWGRLDPNSNNPKKYFNLPIYRNFSKPSELLKIFGNRYTFFPLHCYLTPLSLIQLAGYWNEQLTVNDDGEFFSRVILNSRGIVFSPNTYSIYRSGSGNRLSQLESKEQIIQYIKSLTIIDKTIKASLSRENHPYSKHAKKMLYDRIKKKHPELIEQYAFFFKNRRSFTSTMYFKLLNRIKR